MFGVSQELLSLGKCQLKASEQFVETVAHRQKLRRQSGRVNTTIQMQFIDLADRIGGLLQRTQSNARNLGGQCRRSDSADSAGEHQNQAKSCERAVEAIGRPAIDNCYGLTAAVGVVGDSRKSEGANATSAGQSGKAARQDDWGRHITTVSFGPRHGLPNFIL